MESFYDEIESLEAILMDDVIVHKNPETNIPEMIETTVFPEVDGDSDRQYICVTLEVVPTVGYPDISPEFRLLKPRGLDDERLNQIKAACIKKLDESVGFPVVFDLIEVIREHLAGSNLPSGQCVVCLYGFQEGDEFTKTECYHYLHSFCLSRHLSASKRNWQEEQDKLPAWLKKPAELFQPVCPVCREKIKDDADSLKSAQPPAELENAPDFQLTEDLKKLQIKMSNLFLLQKRRGAIIEVGENEGNIISIEPEDQRQEQRKNGDPHESPVRENVDDFRNSTVPNAHSHQSNRQNHNNRAMQNSRSQQYINPQTSGCAGATATTSGSRVVVNHTNFTPIVNNTPRYATEPTNNNYNHQQHYNRRHYRGNNRRHHHHHQRDHRDQREQNSSSHQEQAQQQQPSTNQSTHPESGTGKQQKSGNGHQGSTGTHKR